MQTPTPAVQIEPFPIALPALAKWALAVPLSLWLVMPATVQTLIVMMGLDFLTGVVVAIAITKNLDSSIGTRGLAKKALVLILIAAAHRLTGPLNWGFDIGGIIAGAFVLTEFISIVENCAKVGVPIPAVLLDSLLKAKSLTGRDRKELETLKETES